MDVANFRLSGGEFMHFHLPKPLHGWREFAGEVGIIVVGVLIALGAEQVVEDLHWRHVASAARESVSGEMDTEFFTASEMVIAQPCVDRQLEQVEAAVLAPGPFHPVPSYSEGPMSFAVRAPEKSWSDNVWKSVSEDGTAAHFDRKTRLGLAIFYSLVEYLREHNARADELRQRLSALSRPIQPDAATRAGFVADIEQARSLYGMMALISNQAIGRAEGLGFHPQASDLRAEGSATLNFCRAHHLPLGKVQRPV
jgi:hypothetical protein